jgi:hypothetical protein
MNTVSNVAGGGVHTVVVGHKPKTARQELTSLLKRLEVAGTKRRDIALVLFAKDYTEAQVGQVMGVDPKTAHAAKVDFSKAGKAKAERLGHRVHLDFSKARLKELDGKKQTANLISLVDKVLGV